MFAHNLEEAEYNRLRIVSQSDMIAMSPSADARREAHRLTVGERDLEIAHTPHVIADVDLPIGRGDLYGSGFTGHKNKIAATRRERRTDKEMPHQSGKYHQPTNSH